MTDYERMFGPCKKALNYIHSEWKYSLQELELLQPELNELFEELMHHNLLEPEIKEEELLMTNCIDNFFYENITNSRRKKMLS
jgi:hypothetical protein